MNGRDFQRDAGMVLLEKPKALDHDPTIRDQRIVGVQKFTIGAQEIMLAGYSLSTKADSKRIMNCSGENGSLRESAELRER